MPIPIIDRRNDGDKKPDGDIKFEWKTEPWLGNLRPSDDTIRAITREMARRVDQSMMLQRPTRTDGGRSVGVEGTMMSFSLPRHQYARCVPLTPELTADAFYNYDPFASAPMPAPHINSDADIPRAGYFTDFQEFDIACMRRRWVKLYSARYEISSPLINIDHIRLRAYELFCQQLRPYDWAQHNPLLIAVVVRGDIMPDGRMADVVTVRASGPAPLDYTGDIIVVSDGAVQL